MTLFATIVVLLLATKLAIQIWLERVNRRHVLAHAKARPEAFREVMDESTYAKSIQYTLAKSRLHEFELFYDMIVLLLVLFSGSLPWAFDRFAQGLGRSAWAMAGFLFLVGVALALPNLPLDWYAQFRLEERFGFNTTTQEVWCRCPKAASARVC